MYPRVQNSKGARKPLWQEPLARAHGKSRFRLVSYPNRIGDIKYIAELSLSNINHTTEQRKSQNFWSIGSPLLCACAVRFARVLALAFLARSLTHSGSHYASPIVHSLARYLRPSLTGSLTLP